MATSEFDIIARYFTRDSVYRDDVVLGVGDDAALLRVADNRLLVNAVDTLVSGRHFLPETDAFDVGYKALAVNLSDLAAMGAEPAWATLALTLPAIDETWLQGFADGFFSLADKYRVALVGGDTTRGPLAMSVQIQGFIEAGKALRRAAARPGQHIYVSGTPGDAAYALQALRAGEPVAPDLLDRLHRPQPRIELGRAISGVAAAAIDISDGLLADLGHILDASGCGATLWPDRLPQSAALQAAPRARALACQLNGGDDYELCFTVDAGRLDQLQSILREQAVPVTEIGIINSGTGIVCQPEDGPPYSPAVHGFDHFIGVDNDRT